MFNPVNRYILIETHAAKDTAESLIVLPEDYNPPKAKHMLASVVNAAADVRFDLMPGNKIVVDNSMIEEITINGTNYNVVLDNYVLGILE